MKRTLTLLFFTFIAFQVSAQSGLNNLGFENWSENNLFNQAQPNGFGSIGQSQNSSDPMEGNLALSLTTKEITNPSNGNKDTLGLSVLGEITSSGPNVGAPFDSCPDSLTGYIRYHLPNQDSGLIAGSVWNATDTLSSIDTLVGDTQDTWVSFSMPFQPNDCMGMTPDSIALVFSAEAVFPDFGYDAGTQTPGQGSFELDGLALWSNGEPTSISELAREKKSKFGVHPNPASSTVRFEHGSLEERVRIFDMTGRNVRNVQLGNGNIEQVSVSGMDEGLYIYRVEGKNGQRLHSGKLQVIH
jgi:hypothetical protein